MKPGQIAGLRFPIALIAALVISATMFGFLRALTLVRGELGDMQQAIKIEFTRLRQDTEVEEKKREKAERSKAQQAPPPPMVTATRSTLNPNDDSGDVSAIATLVEQQAALSGDLSSSGGADRDAVPLVRIDADYPAQALQNKTEGWVVIEFTISTAGTVKDAVVLASEPGSLFDRNALAAVRKYKYNPKIVDGRPVERPGMKVRLDFEMEN